MKKFVIKYRRPGQWLWRKREVIGTRQQLCQNASGGNELTGKLLLLFEDGGCEELPNWRELEIKLGQDWCLATKDQVERDAGQPVKFNR